MSSQNGESSPGDPILARWGPRPIGAACLAGVWWASPSAAAASAARA